MRRLLAVSVLALCGCHHNSAGPDWVKLRDSNLFYDKNSVVKDSDGFTVWLKIDGPKGSNGELLWVSEMFSYKIICHERLATNLQHNATAYDGRVILQPLDYGGSQVGIPPGSYMEAILQEYC